jgi:hypothetical protein
VEAVFVFQATDGVARDPTRAVVDDWIPTGDRTGIVFRMYESGTVVIEHKIKPQGADKYRAVGPKLVLPWEAVEKIRDNYKRYKAIREGGAGSP